MGGLYLHARNGRLSLSVVLRRTLAQWFRWNKVAHVPIPEVLLGTANNYAILAKTGITTVPASVITGDIAVSPIAATA
jgi:hypothetical protein